MYKKKDNVVNERKILQRFIAGKYFKNGDYFTSEQLKNFISFVDDFREFLENQENKRNYKEIIESLIFSNDIKKVLFGINFGRCYLDDKVIYSKLENLAKHPLCDCFQIKVQAIYELLEVENTGEEQKREWFDFLINNLREYKKIFNQVYRINIDEDKMKYFIFLLKKLSETHDNKKWVYLIELIALGINKDKTLEKIIELTKSNNDFVAFTAKKCLQPL